MDWADAARSGRIGGAFDRQDRKCAIPGCTNGPDPRWGFSCPVCKEVFITCDGHDEADATKIQHTCRDMGLEDGS